MRLRYTEWDPTRHGSQKPLFEELFDLFQELLEHTAGDAEEALRWLRQLDEEHDLMAGSDQTIEDFIEELKKRGYLSEDGEDGTVKITAKAERALRRSALEEIFSELRKHGQGDHQTPHTGQGDERLPETRDWQFGDDISRLDATGTLSNSFRRSGLGDDWNLSEDDFQVHETDHHATMSTVLRIDLSHSMVLYGEDRITPARRVAMGLAELLTTKYPKDTLDIVAFGNDAWEIEIEDLPYLDVGPYHTNTRAGLQRARHILHRRNNRNKQIFMITDGKPSCHIENGQMYRNPYGLDPKIVNKVLDEGAICRRQNITITTFMIARDPGLQDFVRELTEVNRGRAYYAELDDLGSFLFEDYVRNRRKHMR